MRYARIENGIVMEIIDFDPKGRFTKEIEKQFVECDEDTKQGFKYDNGVFSEIVKIATDEEFNNNIFAEIKATDSDLIRLVEDIAEWAELQGFVIPQEKKDLISERKNKRNMLK